MKNQTKNTIAMSLLAASLFGIGANKNTSAMGNPTKTVQNANCSHKGLIVGLSLWGTIATVAAAVGFVSASSKSNINTKNSDTENINKLQSELKEKNDEIEKLKK